MSRDSVIALLGEPEARCIVEDLHTDPHESGEWCWTQHVTRDFDAPPVVECWVYRHDTVSEASRSFMLGLARMGSCKRSVVQNHHDRVESR